MSRPRGLAIALAIVLALAGGGCVGFLTGSQPYEFAANATEVDQSTLESTEYRLASSESPNRTLNVTVGGQTRQVSLSSEVRKYNRTVTLAPGVEGEFARFSVYSTPAATVAGQSVNPVGDWSTDRIVRRLVSSTSGLSNVQFESNRSVQFLGAERTVSAYGASQSMGGVETNVTIHLSMVEHDGDNVIAVAVHPERVDERSRVNDLLAGLRHPPAEKSPS
ncbi:DUF6517 family protein [Halosimplex aquaticum]|uniref:DUF6517 family protein n=1 Tax=Halosimplex aquaticum TaxID=3026162 RepID=A0ABD5XW92_9EURY|nr:DUF6517 family protein [Halosimplex aquaticum]